MANKDKHLGLDDDAIKFGARYDESFIDEEEEEEEFPPVPPDDQSPKKKPGEVSGSVDGDDAGASFSRVLKARKSKLSSNFKVLKSDIAELSSAIADATRDLEDVLNAREVRDPITVENGQVAQLLDVIKPLSDIAYSYALRINTNVDADYLGAQSRDILRDIRNDLSDITSAVTNSDAVSMTMRIRNLFLTLMAANTMLMGEPNLVNGHTQDVPDQRDLWRLYQIFTPMMANARGEGAIGNEDVIERNRNMVGDNAIEPDVTLIKPIFLLFPCQELKRDLMQLDIAPELIGDYEDDNDWGILGHFGIPTVYNGNTRQGGLVVEEERTFAGLGYMNMGDDDTPAINEPCFTWSNNGSQLLRQKCLNAYSAQNKEFVAEITALTRKCEETGVREISASVAFCIVLTGWLNGAFKAIVEANFNATSDEVGKGITLNQKRFVGANSSDILFKFITELGIGYDGKEKQTEFDSLLSVLKDSLNRLMSKSVGGKFHYSEKAYQLIRGDFKTLTMELQGATDYYIGDSKLGNSIVKFTIIPKLYLPVDVTVNEFPNLIPPDTDTRAPLALEGSRRRNTLPGIVVHPFNFAAQLNHTHWVVSRNTNENDTLLNISIFHVLTAMSNAEYSQFINQFYASNGITVGNEYRTLQALFGGVSALGYARYWSALAPAYDRAKILGLAPLDQIENPDDDCMIRYPLLDQLGRFQAYRNRDTAWLNAYAPYHLGDYLKAIYNYHADWSWIEAAIVAVGIQTRYMDMINPPQHSGENYYQYPAMHFYPFAGDRRQLVTTTLRTTRAFMDADRYGMKFTRFNAEIIGSDPVPVRSGKLSKADILKAFRYSPYNRTGFYVVDNYVGSDYSNRLYWIQSMQGTIHSIHRCLKEGENIKITEEGILTSILQKANCDGMLLAYDNYHAEAQRLNYQPAVIPGTGLVGYRMCAANGADSLPNRQLLLEDVVTEHTVRRRLHFNDYVYICDDVYPTSMIFTVVAPTETSHTTVVAGDNIHSQNVVFTDIALNYMSRFGMMAGNAQGARVVTQMTFGLHPTLNTEHLIRANDAEVDHVTQGYGGLNYYQVFDVTEDDVVAESFESSWRYPQFVVLPAIGRITGLPAHIPEQNPLNAYDIMSGKIAKHFYDSVGAIIENNNSAVQTYHNESRDSNYYMFELRQGLRNDMYERQDYDFVVTMPARSIIKCLEMEDK